MRKSGIMLGLGEADDELMQTPSDLVAHGCDLLTMGQYLRPSPNHLPVIEYVHPDKFAWWGEQARAIGFESVASGPLVRSSFHADELAGTVKRGEASKAVQLRREGGDGKNPPPPSRFSALQAAAVIRPLGTPSSSLPGSATPGTPLH